MSTTAIRITDDDDQASIGEAIGHLNHLAKREIPVVGTPDYPTPWDTAHRRMDDPLDRWLEARGR
jgi:hypothetical protein